MAKKKEKEVTGDTHAQDVPEGGFQDDFGHPSELLNPNVSEEDQDMEMQPAIVGPPAYASPDPSTNAGRLRPIENHPLESSIAEDYGKDVKGATVAVGEEHPGEPDGTEPSDLDEDLQGDASAAYDEQTKDELMELAAEREIEGRSGMSKTELVDAHEAYDAAASDES